MTAPTDVVIVGVGAVTPIGLSVPETAASMRSRTMRFAEIPPVDAHFDPIIGAAVPDDGLPGIPPLTGKGLRTALAERLMRLAIAPITECLAVLGDSPPRVPLAIAVPTTAAETLDGPAFAAKLTELVPLLDTRGGAVFFDRAGGLAAIGHAATVVTSGVAPYALGGGVDTLLDLRTLGTLDRDRRLKSDTHLDGCIPGEAGAFVLLATRATAQRDGRAALGVISTVAASIEPGHIGSAEPYRGDGLAQTLQALFAAGGTAEPIQEVFTSMNGESYWAKEWGVAHLRTQASFDPNHAIHHPADCVGDTGAACGPLSVILAATGITGRYRRSPCLVYGSSDDGARTALTVAAA